VLSQQQNRDERRSNYILVHWLLVDARPNATPAGCQPGRVGVRGRNRHFDRAVLGQFTQLGIASPLVGGADIGPYLRFATPAIAYAIGLKASRAA